jgi:hypothetical protein
MLVRAVTGFTPVAFLNRNARRVAGGRLPAR